MLPGPPIYKQCPHCAKCFMEFSLMSGNTFGAILWSDGKLDAPMLPTTPLLVVCPFCQGLVWCNEVPEIEDPMASFELFLLTSEAKEYDEPTIDQYAHFLATHTLDADKARYVCIQLWWMHNDVRRKADQRIPLRADEYTNLEQLIHLFDEKDTEQRLMKAEVLRQLSRFAEADALLKQVNDRAYADVVARLRTLVHAQDAALVRLNDSN